MTTTMNVSLPETLRDYIDERVAEGGYANVSDYVRALIREDRTRQAKARLEAKLLEGLESGPAVVADDAYWEDIKKEVRARLAKRKRSR